MVSQPIIMKHDVQKTSFSFKEIFSNFFKILYVNLETLNAIFSVNFAWNHKVLVLYRKQHSNRSYANNTIHNPLLRQEPKVLLKPCKLLRELSSRGEINKSR